MSKYNTLGQVAQMTQTIVDATKTTVQTDTVDRTYNSVGQLAHSSQTITESTAIIMGPFPPGYVPPPAAAALPSAPVQSGPAAASAAPSRAIAAPVDGNGAQSYPEVGGWGQAWGEDEAVPAPPARDRRALYSAAPQTAPASTPSTPAPAAAASAAPARPVVATAVPPATQAVRARGASSPIIGGDDGGDAVGLGRPPRIVPRAALRAGRKDEGDAPPVRMVADEVIYDREFGIVTAKGRVEMQQSSRTIAADTLSYNLKLDVMGAAGNVVMTEPSGEVIFADYFELTGDFKNGVAQQIRAILADNSRLAAQAAQRVGGDRTDFDRAVYTACEPCADDPERTPIWQAKAMRITHNQAEAQIEYRDAWIELAGIPIVYTPYMSHPDPTVKRKSGFLMPTFGMNSSLGPSVYTPYYLVMSDQEDVTLVPRFMFPQSTTVRDPSVNSTLGDAATSVMQRVQLSGEHRWRGVYGESKSQASITSDQKTGDLRGHIESKGLVDLDSTWRAGWQAQYQSDLSYRSLYRVRMEQDRPWLLTRPYVEGFGRRNYAMAETMSFQGQRVIEDNSKSPVVLPHAVYRSVSDTGWAGSYWTFDNDLLSYLRTQGVEAQRVSHRTAWNLPLSTPDGQVMLLTTSARGDGYHARRLAEVSSGEATTARAIPEASLNWRYPFSRVGSAMSQVIEPIAMVAVSPVGGNSIKIPNEDSLDFELDETNVMRPDRLVGLDRVEGGTRGGYGLRWTGYPVRGGMVGIQAAQGWRLHTDSTFGPASGFKDTFSDYVGRIDVAPSALIAFSDRVRLDRTTLQARRNEASMSFGPPALSFSTGYAFLSSNSSGVGTIYPRRQYIVYGLTSALSQYWRASYTLSQDLAAGGGTLSWNGGMVYNDECFAVAAQMTRYYTTLPGLLSGYNLMMTVTLKSLGEAPFSVF